MKMPPVPRWLGLSGLLPLIALVLMLGLGWWPQWRAAALLLGLGYAALILSFLGGLWWGLAARADSPPVWLWGMAVVPSLYAWVPLGLVMLGLMEVRVGLAALGFGLLLALLVDRALEVRRLTPGWWMGLRVPLSLGLGGLCLAAAGLA